MTNKNWIEISASALRSNVIAYKKYLGRDVSFLAVVKANSYGLGIRNVALAIKNDVDWWGVDSLAEANEIRSIDLSKPILIMGYVSKNDAREVVDRGYSVVAYTDEFVETLSKYATPQKPARVHIKVDTGLIRLGVAPMQVPDFVNRMINLSNIVIEGFCTHFATFVDKNNVPNYYGALAVFKAVLETFKNSRIKCRLIHIASSLPGLLFKELRYDMVRVGIPMYGVWGRKNAITLLQSANIALNLLPVITWKTIVVNIKQILKGTGVGYGNTEVVKRDTKVAVLGAGFFEGIDKRYAKTGCVLINGNRAKILGGIAMNMCVVDVTDIENVQIGDLVIIIGKSGNENISVNDIADTLHTSSHEVLTRINSLLPRYLCD